MPSSPTPTWAPELLARAYYSDDSVVLIHGDCLDVLAAMPDASVDAIVTDPPYGLGFMGKAWDDLPPGLPWAVECLRVLKPGGHLLAFGGTRTWHRLACAVEDAGFEMRDSIAWLYGSGFPKSMDVGKAIDKANGEGDRLHRFTRWLRSSGVTPKQLNDATGTRMGSHYLTAGSQPAIPTPALWSLIRPLISDVPGWVDELVARVEAEREVVGARKASDRRGDATVIGLGHSGNADITAPATPAAQQWDGWGTALKPAFEPVVCARKPLAGTVAANVLAHGTGALNIDGCRVGLGDERPPTGSGVSLRATSTESPYRTGDGPNVTPTAGRWPANVILDESREPVLRLRYNLPTEVERTIRESFGASTDHLPAVRDTRDGAAEQGQASEVLLPQVPGALDVGEPDGRARSEVGQAAHAGNSGADLGDQEGQPPHGREGRELEGWALPQSGVRLREVVDAPAERAGDLRADGDPQRRDLHTGAPASRGAATRAGADLRGDRASRERTQGGQPAGEPGAPRVEQLAPDEARRGRRRDVPAATGERTTPGRPLEVLRRECPPGWWHYFEVVGHRREGQAAALDEQSGVSSSVANIRKRAGTSVGNGETLNRYAINEDNAGGFNDSGGASRFFYTAKATSAERPKAGKIAHPTVKPLDLMRWLVRLVTPPGGVALDPFAGSGTTLEAAIVEGFRSIGIEREADYLPLIEQRIARACPPLDFTEATA